MEHRDTKAAPQQGAMRYVLLGPAEIASSLARHKNQARSGALFGFALATVLIITGCTGGNSLPNSSDGPPLSSTSPTAVATTKSAPETTAEPIYKPATDQGPAENVPVPMLPEKAKEFSKEGLLAFSEHWYQTLGYLYETGDSIPMTSISDPSCKTCTFVIEPLVQLYNEGGWAVGGQMKVYESSSQFVPDDAGTYSVTLMVQQMKVTAYTSEGEISNEYPQRRARTNVFVAIFEDQKWRTITAEPIKEN